MVHDFAKATGVSHPPNMADVVRRVYFDTNVYDRAHKGCLRYQVPAMLPPQTCLGVALWLSSGAGSALSRRANCRS